MDDDLDDVLGSSGSDLLRGGRRRREGAIPELSLVLGRPWRRRGEVFPAAALTASREEEDKEVEGRRGEEMAAGRKRGGILGLEESLAGGFVEEQEQQRRPK